MWKLTRFLLKLYGLPSNNSSNSLPYAEKEQEKHNKRKEVREGHCEIR